MIQKWCDSTSHHHEVTFTHHVGAARGIAHQPLRLPPDEDRRHHGQAPAVQQPEEAPSAATADAKQIVTHAVLGVEAWIQQQRLQLKPQEDQ